MINLYAYTYPSAMAKYDGYILTKVGDSTRDVDIRIDEQGGAAVAEKAKTVAQSYNKGPFQPQTNSDLFDSRRR